MIEKVLQYPTQTILNEIDKNVIEAALGEVSLWDVSKRHKNIEYHKHARNIPLITWDNIDGVAQRDTMTTHVVNRYPGKWPETNLFMQTVEKMFNCSVKTINIVKLEANMEVYPHIDGGEFYATHDRYHFVLQGEYEFTVGDDQMVCSKGCVYRFDNTLTHSVRCGDEERIALIFDALPLG